MDKDTKKLLMLIIVVAYYLAMRLISILAK